MDARAIADVLAVSRQEIVEALADIAPTLREQFDGLETYRSAAASS